MWIEHWLSSLGLSEMRTLQARQRANIFCDWFKDCAQARALRGPDLASCHFCRPIGPIRPCSPGPVLPPPGLDTALLALSFE